MSENLAFPVHSVDAEAAALQAALTALYDEFQRLLDAATRKLEALRRADTAALQDCTEGESAALAAALLALRRKDAALAGLAQRLRAPVDESSTVSAVAARLHEPLRSHIQARITGLRELATKLREKNKLAEGVARNLHSCVRAVFAEIARANRETVSYGPGGQMQTRVTEAWIDAVG